MAKRLLANKLINKNKISKELKPIQESECSYITKDGEVYVDYGNELFYPLSTYLNKHNGYVYVGFKGKNGKMLQRRVHVLVAKAFLPNPNNYPYVCHKDDDKTNPKLDNLEWGTASSNTKDAYDRGLAKTAKGWDDSQSKPVCCFDLDGNFIKHYGSVSECSKLTGVTKRGIIFQCDHLMKSKPRKGYYYRYFTEYKEHGFVL